MSSAIPSRLDESSEPGRVAATPVHRLRARVREGPGRGPAKRLDLAHGLFTTTVVWLVTPERGLR